jgi:hypothetical protein
MKLTAIIGTAIAAVGLAACGSSPATPTARPATPTPTVAPTPTATPAPTPIATPTAPPTPMSTPTPGVYVTVTCSNVPYFWDQSYAAGTKLGIATFHGVKVGDLLSLGVGDMTPITSDPFSGDGVVGLGSSADAFTQGTWNWFEFTPAGSDVASGTLTIPACPPSLRVTACDHAGTASGGAISWSEPDYSTLTITGPAPSIYHFTLPASAGQYGPLTAGTYTYSFNAYQASVLGTFTIPACPGKSI